MKIIKVKTSKHELDIEVYSDSINSKDINIKKELFNKMCKEGCKNYGNKYSCPPFAPNFDKYVKKDKLFVVMFLIRLDQFKEFNYKNYFEMKIANAVIKPKIEKLMMELEKITKTKFLGTGACRLCKPCKKKMNKSCEHQDKRRFSLEALGVDCNDLALRLFKKPLLWYNKKDKLGYTAVMCAVSYDDEKTRSINIPNTDILITFRLDLEDFIGGLYEFKLTSKKNEERRLHEATIQLYIYDFLQRIRFNVNCWQGMLVDIALIDEEKVISFNLFSKPHKIPCIPGEDQKYFFKDKKLDECQEYYQNEIKGTLQKLFHEICEDQISPIKVALDNAYKIILPKMYEDEAESILRHKEV